MKVSIQRSLLADFAGRLAGAIQKSNSAMDEGKYVLLYVSDGKLVGMVNGRDIFAQVVLDSKLIDDKDLLHVVGDGKFAVNGVDFVNSSNSNLNGIVDVTFEENVDGFARREGEDYEGLIKPTGSLCFCFPGLTATREVGHLQCVEQPKPGPCDPDVENHIMVEAKDLLAQATNVGVAAGKNSASLDYSQVVIRTVKDKQELELATHDGYEIGWAKFEIPEKTGPVFGIVPYDTLMSICKMSDKEIRISISNTKTGAKGLLFEQEYKYGGKTVGMTKYCARSVSEKFVEFEKVIKNLSFKFSCTVNRECLLHVAEELEKVDSVKTSVSFDPAGKTLTFSKASSMSRKDKIVLPLTSADGEKLELEFSSKILKKAVDHCEKENEIVIKFSGKRSLGMIKLNKDCKLFFAPFAEG